MWFEFTKGGGVVQFNAGARRMGKMTFSEFIDTENLYKLPFKN